MQCQSSLLAAQSEQLCEESSEQQNPHTVLPKWRWCWSENRLQSTLPLSMVNASVPLTRARLVANAEQSLNAESGATLLPQNKVRSALETRLPAGRVTHQPNINASTPGS